MTTETLTVRGGVADDLRPFAELAARCFQNSVWTYDAILYVTLESIPQNPGYRHEYARVAYLGDQLVSEAQVVPYTATYGAATLHAGGVAYVCTDESHRGRGYAGAVMRDAVAYMQTTGFDVSFLNSGPDGYYNRFGYTPCWPIFNLRVEPPMVDCLVPGTLGADLTVRDLFGDDVPAMLALYGQDYAGRPGARVRDLPYLQWKLSWGFPHRRGAFTADGQLRGYVIGWGHEWLSEVIIVDQAAAAALLRDNAQIMRERETDDAARDKPFWWSVPPDAPTAAHVRALCTASTIAYTRPAAGWMARILNLHSTFEKLLPELEARLLDSARAGWEGALRLETDIGSVTLKAARGRLALDGRARPTATARLSQADLVQLMFAYVPPEEIAARAGVHIDAEALRLLGALFPRRAAYIAGVDWY